ncbi:zinc finger CCCH domain-containing 2-like [Olea europaea subsp. europaea]|uniref:Zinc finger CCCH domain-containing 2-like n=1 Tax=Olea europaea subsp. europaea TaxID=158383 RepID=A0A8S0VFE3_OLEEU|nr:zinc finger CCCH domain-containing 2-like [Olea europaea subsp. europaea]
MGSICADQHQLKFHQSHQLYHKKSTREIDIPPRKLFSRRSASSQATEMFMDSPKSAEDGLFQRFLPYNNVDDDDADPYSSDRFRMYEFKVRKCTRSRSHDWTDCPFAHPGEKARRRDPRRYHYSGTVCEEFRKGHCSKGDNCEFAHGVFECWLHPTRYRTEACKDGKNCKRKVCFFAHSTKQLRILSDNSSSPLNSLVSVEKKYNYLNHCCVHCHSMIASPTSTLMIMSHLSSPPFSPPISPGKTPEFSRRPLESSALNEFHSGGMSYKDAFTELMGNLEAMNLKEAAASQGNLFNLDHEQSQLLLSPSTPIPAGSNTFFNGDVPNRDFTEGNKYNINESGPDFGWVNDLLT